jgi:hypothetical protein
MFENICEELRGTRKALAGMLARRGLESRVYEVDGYEVDGGLESRVYEVDVRKYLRRGACGYAGQEGSGI